MHDGHARCGGVWLQTYITISVGLGPIDATASFTFRRSNAVWRRMADLIRDLGGDRDACSAEASVTFYYCEPFPFERR